MDPISSIGAAGSCLAFASAAISTATAIIDLINKIQEAPQIISDLNGNLMTLRVVLDRLAKTEALVHRDDGKADDSASPTRDAVCECNKVLKKMITDVLSPLQDKL